MGQSNLANRDIFRFLSISSRLATLYYESKRR